MSVQKGSGIRWSLPNFALTGTGVYATGIVHSVQYGLDGDRAQVKGADGVDVTDIFYNTKDTLTVEVVPSGATLAAAKACVVLPVRGADITVADTDDTGSQMIGSGTGNGTGTYKFISGSINLRADQTATLTMVLERGETHLATVAAS